MGAAERGLVTAMSIRVRAEIISYGRGSLKGFLHSQFLETPFVFFDVVRMLKKMEDIFDTNRFPERFVKPRTFGIAKSEKIANEKIGSDSVKELESPAINEDAGGIKCTFEISVRFRQNATWQGQILWAEKNVKQNFRSALEMLKLMDEAISEGEEDSLTWDT